MANLINYFLSAKKYDFANMKKIYIYVYEYVYTYIYIRIYIYVSVLINNKCFITALNILNYVNLNYTFIAMNRTD